MTTTTTTDLSDLCREVAGVIEDRGLANGTRRDNSGRLCFIGAFGWVQYQDPYTGEYEAVNAVAERMERLGYISLRRVIRMDITQSVADWSNQQAAADNAIGVINVLRDVADTFDQDPI